MQKFDLVLVSCCGQKLDRGAVASKLYTSQLFKASKQYAEKHGDNWAILSAKHGIVEPHIIVQPYDLTLTKCSVFRKVNYARHVMFDLGGIVKEFNAEHSRPMRIAVLAGRHYLDPINLVGSKTWARNNETLRPIIELPLEGKGIGQRLSWLKKANTQMEHNNEQLHLFA